MGTDFERRVVQITLFPSPHCSDCLVGPKCHEQNTELGCSALGPADPTLLDITSPDFFLRFAEVGGFELDVQARLQALPRLPHYIPAMRPNEWRGTPPRLGADTLAIQLTDVLALAKKVEKRQATAKQILGMTPEQQLIVLGFASDEFLERNWPESRRSTLLTAIKRIEPDGAVAWNYSVWHRHTRGWAVPRLEQRYNLKRSLKVYAELQAIGIPAIPHIYWGLLEDIELWSLWLRESPTVTHFSVDLQTLDHDRAWRRALEALTVLRRKLGSRPLHALFSGVCVVRRVRELKAIWPDSSLTNLGAQFGCGRFR